MRKALPCCLIALCLGQPHGLAAGERAPVVWQRTVKDHIGHDWHRELIHFELPGNLSPKPARHRLVLVREGVAREIPFQVAASKRGRRPLWCVVDLPAFGEITLRLEAAAASKQLAAPMPIVEKEDRWQIDNGVICIEVPRTHIRTADVPPPLLRVRNTGGSPWVGSSRFKGTGAKIDLTVSQVRGPVWTEVEYYYGFANGTYEVAIRLVRGRPEVLWRERFNFDKDGASLEWDVSAGTDLDTGVWDYYRSRYPWRKTGMGVSKAYTIAYAKGPEITTFAPWIRWWLDDVTTWLELWDRRKEWAVGIFTGNVLDWRDRDNRVTYDASAFRLVLSKDRRAVLSLPLGKGVRTFGISLARRTPDERIGPNVRVGPTDTARRQIRYAETSLDEVKDYVFDYDATPASSYPLFALGRHPGDAPRAKPLDDAGGFWHMGVSPDRRPWPKTPSKDALARAALAGAGKSVATHLRCVVMRESLAAVRCILRHRTGPAMGIAPHNWLTSGPTRYLSALIDLAMPYLTRREWEVLRARMIFLGYKLASENFWSPRLGLSANPNMTTLVRAQLAFVSFLLPRHPRAAAWRKAGVDEMLHELNDWSGPNGGWLEAPHYATVSLDHIVAVGSAMRNLKLGEEIIYHEKLKKAIGWLAKISTPPDPRFKGLRHLPPIGNTWGYETSCLFGYMAKLYRGRDDEYANAMRWMWEQQGLPRHPGIGGAYPTTDGFRESLLDTTPSTGPPKWGSELFPGSGAVLRSGFPGKRETHFYLIQGPMHDHYDDDQGSFELWGKGRPLCLDFGYHGYDPAEHHSRVDVNGKGEIAAFATQPFADFLHNSQGAWNRHVLFVKDAEALGPNYFLLRDAVAKGHPRPANWRLWLNTAADPKLDGSTVRVTGRDDVDLDIWFPPSARALLPVAAGTVKTTELSISTHSAGPRATTQRCLHLVLKGPTVLEWLLYPRLRTERPPTVTPLGRPGAVKVESPRGTDYVFLTDQPTAISAENIQFHGTAGVIQVRPKTVTLTLVQGGRLRFGRFELRSTQPATKQFAK